MAKVCRIFLPYLDCRIIGAIIEETSSSLSKGITTEISNKNTLIEGSLLSTLSSLLLTML